MELYRLLWQRNRFKWDIDRQIHHRRKYYSSWSNPLDALLFRDSFEAARQFNSKLKQGLLAELIFAPLYEEAPAADSLDDAVDNPDINKEPEEHDHQDAFGGDDDWPLPFPLIN